MIDFTGTYTDEYELTMAQVYFRKGYGQERAVFDYFFRSQPFNSGYTIFAGLEDLLRILETLRFDRADIEYLSGQGYNPEFLNYLKNFRFRGNVYSSPEGDVIFPTRPVLSVEAPLIEAQLIETLLLNILNFETLIATKASRMRQAAVNCKLIDFGLRRAHGPAGYYASRAAIIGGFESTSNVRAGRDFGIPISGTMAHSFVQRYDDELAAFRDFAGGHPENCVLLVDTYDTLKSGVPNAIKVGKEMARRGQRLLGIRLDSGDLAYLSRQARRMLDEAGLDYVKIAASNQLDEHVIESLLKQGAPINFFGVGTKLVTGPPDASLDGVYKLAFANGGPRLKLSETTEKISLPHLKQVFRVLNGDGNFFGADAVALAGETDVQRMHHPSDPLKSLRIDEHEKEPLLHQVMKDGERTADARSLQEIAGYSKKRMKQLPSEYKRFINPHLYKVGLSTRLKEVRDSLVEAHRKELEK
ncbi:MAG: nicotinate phosphoribosyltransferase [Candidatus Krumholzibacteriota bacterium]